MPTLRAELASRGLKASGTFTIADLSSPAVWPTIEKQVLQTGELLANMNARFLVLISSSHSDERTFKLLRPVRLDDEGWKRLIDATHRADDLARAKFGLQLVFHPHADTHVEYEDQMVRFLEDTAPNVMMCLDTGHFAYRHGDPAAFMRKYAHRIPYLHVKSVDESIRRKVEAENIPFAAAVVMDMFCELAEGAVDFAAFRDVLQECDYQSWAIVEQDMYPAPFDKPLPIAARNRRYLSEIGIG